MKYRLAPKYKEIEEDIINRVRQILPACEALAYDTGKDVTYVTSMVLRSLTTVALQRHRTQGIDILATPKKAHGSYHARFLLWCDDDLISTSEGDAIDDFRAAPGEVYRGLDAVRDAALDFAEGFISEDDEWPEELDEGLVARRLRTQRGNVYKNASGQVLVNVHYRYRHAPWLLQVVLSRHTPADELREQDITETPRRGLDKLREMKKARLSGKNKK